MSLCRVSYDDVCLNAERLFMLSVFMLSVFMLSVFMPSVFMLSVIMPSG